jgi:WW domain-binding protein 4
MRRMPALHSLCVHADMAGPARTGQTWAEAPERLTLFSPLNHRDNGMYYGGDPPAWTTAPAIPDGARFEHSGHAKGGPGEPADGGAGAFFKERFYLFLCARCSTAHPTILRTPLTRALPSSSHTTGPGPSSTAAGLGAKRRVIEKKAHPLAGIGGFSVPIAGFPGSGRSTTAARGVATQKPGAGGSGGGRGAGAKPISKEEQEALAKREAARQRVAQRSAAYFGM